MGVGIFSYAADNPIIVSDPVGLKALRCKVFTVARPYKFKCGMLGECTSIFDPWDIYVTFGSILIEPCFDCPKKCTFEAHGDGPIWHDPATGGWDCTPWTPIHRAKEGPLDGDI